MARQSTTVGMSQAHESTVAEYLEGKISRGSGNQFNRPGDVWTPRGLFRFMVECKSTRNKSFSITRKTWKKTEEQAHDALPAMAIRFYEEGTARLLPHRDLVVLRLEDFAELLERANQ